MAPLSFVVGLDSPDGLYRVHMNLSGLTWLLSGVDIPEPVTARLANLIAQRIGGAVNLPGGLTRSRLLGRRRSARHRNNFFTTKTEFVLSFILISPRVFGRAKDEQTREAAYYNRRGELERQGRFFYFNWL